MIRLSTGVWPAFDQHYRQPDSREEAVGGAGGGGRGDAEEGVDHARGDGLALLRQAVGRRSVVKCWSNTGQNAGRMLVKYWSKCWLEGGPALLRQAVG